MVFSNNLLMGAASTTAAPAAGWVPKGAIWLDGSADYLSRTPGSAGNRKTWTFSAWVKRSEIGNSENNRIFNAGTSAVEYLIFGSGSSAGSDQLELTSVDGAGNECFKTTAVYRDPTAWMHIVVVVDTANTIAANRAALFVNGTRVTAFAIDTNPSLDDESHVNNTVLHTLAVNSYNETSQFFDGYMSEIILLDGYAASPSDFGTEDSNGVWIPKDPTDVVTTNKGTNGFWLDFADSSDLGNDVSYSGLSVGTDNSWTLNSMSSANWTYDRPADSGSDTGNYCTWNVAAPENQAALTYSNGNLTVNCVNSSGAMGTVCTTETGKWYYEITMDVDNTFGTVGLIGAALNIQTGGLDGNEAAEWCWQDSSGVTRNNSSAGPTLSTFTAGDVLGWAIDFDNDLIWCHKNGTWQNSATLAEVVAGTATNAVWSGTLAAAVGGITPSAGCNGGTSSTFTLNCGQSAFNTAIPTGFNKLNTANLPSVTVTKPSDNFLPILYEGNGASQRVGNFIPFTDSHTVNYSARFDKGDSDHLYWTPSGAGNVQVWTFSTWIKRGDVGSAQIGVIGTSPDGNNFFDIRFSASDTLEIGQYSTSGYDWRYITNQEFDDTSNWMHLVVAVDTTAGSGSRVFIYINGTKITDDLANNFSTADEPSASFNTDFLDGSEILVGGRTDSVTVDLPFDGYLSEVIVVDGYQLAASVFGQTDTSTNRWIPKEVTAATLNAAGGGSSGFGTNGFYLNMALKNALGTDVSGNSPANTFAMNNMDTTNGSNQMYDTPTRNLPVISPLAWINSGAWDDSNVTMSQGNLTAALTNSANGSVSRTWDKWAVDSGKWYIENTVITYATWSSGGLGIVGAPAFGTSGNPANPWPNITPGVNYYTDINSTSADSVNRRINGSAVALENPTLVNGDTMAIAVDLDSSPKTIKMYFKNVLKDTTTLPDGYVWMFITSYTGNGTSTYNFGQWINLNSVDMTLDSDAGGYFRYTPPTGYKAVTQDNMPENTAGITGLAWIKNRDDTDFHIWFDRARGIYNYLRSSNASGNTTDGYANQASSNNTVQRFLQQGVQVGHNGYVNTSGESFVLWNWANDGTSTGIAIDEYSSGVPTLASTVRANTDAGFSIVTYSGDSDATTKVGHGLGVKPDLIIVKGVTRASGTAGWYVYHSSVGATKALWLDLNSAAYDDPGYWGDIEPTNQVWSMQANTGMNQSGSTYVAWCWAGVDGYSRFGSYTGNGDTSGEGPYVYLGFKPSWVMVKRTDTSNNWGVLDDKRNSYNPVELVLYADLDQAEAGSGNQYVDFTSNGFKIKNDATANWINASGGNYVYAAFADNPFGGSGIAQAKAR